MSKLDLDAMAANKNVVAREYWKKRLEGFELKSYFADRSRGGSRRSPDEKPAIVCADAPDALCRSLDAIAPSDKAKHLVLLSTLGILAQKYSSDEDLCLFTPSGGAGLQPGAHIIPFRMNAPCRLSFKNLLKAIKEDFVR